MDHQVGLLGFDEGVGTHCWGYSSLLNTLGYAAPEVIMRVGHNKPADIWSVGVITYTV